MIKRTYTEEENQFILANYLNGKTNKQFLCDKLGISYNTLNLHLKVLGIDKGKRRYKINDDYFSNIDSEDKAYFYGLLLGDGNVLENRNRIQIKLQERDCYILKLFKKYLNSNNPLKFCKRREKHHHDSLEFTIHSTKMKNDLINLGCIPRKSLVAKLPSLYLVPRELMRHVIRGYSDANGSVGLKKKTHKTQQIMFSICGSKYICNDISKFLAEELNLPVLKPIKRKNIMVYSVNGNRQIRLIFNYLYKDAKIFLSRKYDKFKVIESCKDSSRKSKYKGVNADKTGKYWRARKSLNGKRFYLGEFPTEQEAINAVLNWEKENNRPSLVYN